MIGQRIGYARVSSTDQSLDVQLGQLEQAGCNKIFSEQKSGASLNGREQLDACLAYVREGDTLVITRLDRMGRSVRDTLQIIERLLSKGVAFECINQSALNIDPRTKGPMEQLILTIFAAFAEFELGIRRERQMEGIAKAKEAKKLMGTERKYDYDKVIAQAWQLREQFGWDCPTCAQAMKPPISPRHLRRITQKEQRDGVGIWLWKPPSTVPTPQSVAVNVLVRK